MSVVEKAGADILKASFSKKGKKKTKKEKAANEEAAANLVAPESIALDFAKLSSLGYFNPEDRSSQLALELRAVKRRLLRRIGYLRASGERQAFRTPGKQRNVILITSTRAGEGKTFTAINLALSLALEDQIETLLIDGDLTRPKIRERLGLPKKKGLSDCLSNPDLDPERLGWRIEDTSLTVMPEGVRTGRPTDFFMMSHAQRVWTDIAAADPDRLVIIDAPPVLAATDAVVLAKHADEILFVVEANTTPEPAVAAAVDELIDINPNVSLMLNRCQIGAGGAHYGSYEYYDRTAETDGDAAKKKTNEG